MCVAVLAACTSSPIATPADSVVSPPESTSSTAVATSAPESTGSTAVETSGPLIEVAPLGAAGGGSGGNPLSTVRLRPGQGYRFADLLPSMQFEPPNAQWEVRGYDSRAVRLRWRGESGAHPGSLVIVVFAGLTEPEERTWSEIEAVLDEGFARVGSSLQWVAEGSAVVGTLGEVAWRELRTGSTRPVEADSAPCVVTLWDRECVWFDSSARLLVVPVEDFSVPILVTEQLCDCDLGGLGRLRRDNELADHLTLVAETLEAISFED